MGFSREEYWSGLPFLTPGDLPDPGIEPTSLVSPPLAGGFFYQCATWSQEREKTQELNLIYASDTADIKNKCLFKKIFPYSSHKAMVRSLSVLRDGREYLHPLKWALCIYKKSSSVNYQVFSLWDNDFKTVREFLDFYSFLKVLPEFSDKSLQSPLGHGLMPHMAHLEG